MPKQPTCADRVQARWESRLADFVAMFALEDLDDHTEDGDNLNEYGLSFDYVEPGRGQGQTEGYWCYLLGTGGPGTEIRFFTSPGGYAPYRIEFWFLDWFDGASLDVTGDATMGRLWDWFAPTVEGYDYDGGSR